MIISPEQITVIIVEVNKSETLGPWRFIINQLLDDRTQRNIERIRLEEKIEDLKLKLHKQINAQ